MEKKKILVVDDEKDIVESIKFRLEQDNFEVVTANDGYQALGAVRVHQPDLIIPDVMLPNENGYRVASYNRFCCCYVGIYSYRCLNIHN